MARVSGGACRDRSRFFLPLVLIGVFAAVLLIEEALPDAGDAAHIDAKSRQGSPRDVLAQSATDPFDKNAPTVRMPDGSLRPRDLVDRVNYLERKVSALLNWLPDPQLMRRKQHDCKNESSWNTNDDMRVCLDHWQRDWGPGKGRPCIVYDLGIREQPMFGRDAAVQFGCHVRAYDPSPVTAKWWNRQTTDDARLLRGLGKRWQLNKYGAGGFDGELELFQYNWGQISIVKQEMDNTLNIPHERMIGQEVIKVPVKTLPTMMKDNGDTEIDVLKIDVEGSEYVFMQDIFDRWGCPPVEQITLEYHHFSIDDRYGSSPEINTVHKLLNDCGYKSFYVRDHWRNHVVDPKTPATYYISPKRYTMASYCRDCWKP